MRQSDNDKVTVVGAGVTLEEAILAYDTLKGEGINIRVIDPFTIKPIDKDLLVAASNATGGRFVTVEDHYPWGESCDYHTAITWSLRDQSVTWPLYDCHMTFL